MSFLPLHKLWFSHDASEWDAALKRYWDFIPSRNVTLEQAMERLDRELIRRMSSDEWFAFLENEYFRWKYTAPNRYATTTAVLKRKGGTETGRLELCRLKAQILNINPVNIHESIFLITNDSYYNCRF